MCDKKNLVISDFTVTCLPISGPPTCQERPKYSVLLMKRICSSRNPGLLTSGLISSLGLLVFQGTFEKQLLVFLKALLSPGLVVSPESSPSPKIQGSRFSLECEICPRYCFTSFSRLSLLVSSFPIFPFSPSSYFFLSLCLAQVCLLLQFILVKIRRKSYLHLMTGGSFPMGGCWKAKKLQWS